MFLPDKFVREPALLIPGRKPLGRVALCHNHPFFHPTGLFLVGGLQAHSVLGQAMQKVVVTDAGHHSTQQGVFERVYLSDYYRTVRNQPSGDWSMFFYGMPTIAYGSIPRRLIGFAEAPNAGTHDRQIQINSSGNWSAYLYDGVQRHADTSVLASPDKFTALLATCDGSVLKLFIDGVLAGSVVVNNHGYQEYSSAEFLVGNSSSASVVYFVFKSVGVVDYCIPDTIAKQFTKNPDSYLKPAGGAW